MVVFLLLWFVMGIIALYSFSTYEIEMQGKIGLVDILIMVLIGPLLLILRLLYLLIYAIKKI